MLLIDRLWSAEEIFADECLSVKIAYVDLQFVLSRPSESFRDVVASDVAIYVERTVNSHSLFVVKPLCLNPSSFDPSMCL